VELAGGHFSATVSSGTYALSAVSPSLHIGRSACSTRHNLKVRQKATIRVTIDCSVH